MGLELGFLIEIGFLLVVVIGKIENRVVENSFVVCLDLVMSYKFIVKLCVKFFLIDWGVVIFYYFEL